MQRRFPGWVIILASLVLPSKAAALDLSSLSLQAEVQFPQLLRLGFEESAEGWLSQTTGVPLRGYAALGGFGWSFGGGGDSGFAAVIGIEAGVRYFPWQSHDGPLRGAFVGLGLGWRRASLDVSADQLKIEGQQIATHGAITLNTVHLPWVVGWEWLNRPGFSLSSAVGIQLAVLGSGTIFLENRDEGTNSDTDDDLVVDSTPLNRVARLPFPEVTLIRLTWRPW